MAKQINTTVFNKKINVSVECVSETDIYFGSSQHVGPLQDVKVL
jgi:hypothetical protein